MTPDITLTEHIRLGLNYLRRNPDPANQHRPYFDVFFSDEMSLRGSSPTANHSAWDFGDVGSRFIRSFIHARYVLGIKDPLPEELELRNLVLSCFAGDGLIHRPSISRNDWNESSEDMHLWDQGQTLMTLAALHQEKPDDALLDRMNGLILGLQNLSIPAKKGRYFPWESARDGKWIEVDRNTHTHYYIGVGPGIHIPGLVRCGKALASQSAIDLATNLAEACFESAPFPLFDWNGTFLSSASSEFFGHRYIHVHARTQTLLGILELGIELNDDRWIQFVRRSLDWLLRHSTTYGWCPEHMPYGSNHWGEICTTADVVEIMLTLVKLGYQEYWAKIERFTRNHLVETQHTDEASVLACCQHGPPAGRMAHFESQNIFQSELGQIEAVAPSYSTQDEVVARNLGGSEGAVWPDEHRGLYVSGCCSPRLVDALCLVQRAVLSEGPDGTTINMLFNLETNSTLRLEILTGDCDGFRVTPCRPIQSLQIRMPDWFSNLSKVSATHSFVVSDRCLVFSDVQAGVGIECHFPFRRETISEYLAGDQYDVTWHGNAVTDIEAKWPRVKPRIPLYKNRNTHGIPRCTPDVRPSDSPAQS